MDMRYEAPIVEIVDFLTMEKLANNRAEIEARDGGARAGGEGGNAGLFSRVDDGWEEW